MQSDQESSATPLPGMGNNTVRDTPWSGLPAEIVQPSLRLCGSPLVGLKTIDVQNGTESVVK